MAGTMQPAPEQGMPPQQPQPQQAAQSSWLDAGEEPASPEEQALYEHFVAKALMLIYSKQGFKAVQDMLRAGDDPIAALAKTAAMVVFRVQKMAEKDGQELGGDLLLHAGAEIYADLAELATRMRVHDFDGDQKAFDTGWLGALDEYRLMAGPGMNKAQVDSDFKSVVEADKTGALGAKMKEVAARSAQEQPQPPPGKSRGLMPSAAGEV